MKGRDNKANKDNIGINGSFNIVESSDSQVNGNNNVIGINSEFSCLEGSGNRIGARSIRNKIKGFDNRIENDNSNHCISGDENLILNNNSIVSVSSQVNGNRNQLLNCSTSFIQGNDNICVNSDKSIYNSYIYGNKVTSTASNSVVFNPSDNPVSHSTSKNVSYYNIENGISFFRGSDDRNLVNNGANISYFINDAVISSSSDYSLNIDLSRFINAGSNIKNNFDISISAYIVNTNTNTENSVTKIKSTVSATYLDTDSKIHLGYVNSEVKFKTVEGYARDPILEVISPNVLVLVFPCDNKSTHNVKFTGKLVVNNTVIV
jgi:hypothetical protein